MHLFNAARIANEEVWILQQILQHAVIIQRDGNLEVHLSFRR